MIYPTRAAILAAGAGAPVALLVATLLPGRWYVALAWPVAVLVAALADALQGSAPHDADIRLALPETACVGAEVKAQITVAIAGAFPPAWCEIALQATAQLAAADDGRAWLPLDRGAGAAVLPLAAVRRGSARVEQLWLRWRGRLGLVWKQRTIALDGAVAILPDVRAARERGIATLRREALQGLVTQRERADGADFDTLVEFRAGMDRRAIDWKQSARHLKLHAKEYRAERNSQIVFAIDAGRQMSEPVAGLSRLDRIVAAMLLCAWIALKLGDRVALHAFDARPRIASGLVSGAAAFGELQRLAARIDYSGEETNYTFALTTLAARLTRRSMIVLFTEITDPTSAEFMVRAADRLMKTHLMLVVVLQDEELEVIVGRSPDTADDVTRSVTAAALLKDRLTVLARLRHLGAHVIECPHDQVEARLVAGYADLKRRNLL